MMRKIHPYLIGIFVFISLSLPAQPAGKYRVSFLDKNNSPYSVSTPQNYLSTRAIARRSAQGISITMQDLPINPAYVAGVANVGVSIINKSKWFNSIVVDILNTTQYNQISALTYVDTLEFLAPPTIKAMGKDKFEMEMLPWAVPYAAPKKIGVINYGMAANQATMISVDYLHDLGFTGTGMHIAVIDAGFIGANTSPIFDSVWNSNRILGHKDFAEIGADIFAAHTHGTMVFSIMGGNIPGQMVGTAPDASYWLLRSEIGASEYVVEEDNWVAAAEFADSAGVDVINSSLGYTEFYDLLQSHTFEEMDGNSTRVTIGADIAASKGMLIVNSAGNSGGSNWQVVGAPADGDSVLSIGAVDAFGAYASFSSTGPTYDGRIKPDVVAQGLGTTYGDPWGSISSGNGTSFSSPVMAGAAACLWQAFPSFTNVEIMQAIRQSASQYNTPDSLLGYGIPNFAAAATILGSIAPVVPRENLRMEAFYDGQTQIQISLYGLRANASLRLLDVSGKELIRREIKADQSIPVRIEYLNSNLSSGLYFLHLSTIDGKISSRKIVL